MALTKTQVKAVILILLVVGQDCMRIQRTTSNAHLQRRLFATTEPAEEQLREANQQCSWKTLKGGCTGPACSFRPLPLDASLSESCRLTNDYMLNSSDRDNYVSLSGKIIEEKSEKFKNECGEAKFWQLKQKARCYRRAGHMLQSTELLMRAEKQKPTQEDADRVPEVDRAIRNIAGVFGEDGQYIIELRDKMKSDLVGVAKDLEGSFKSMIGNLHKLLTGSESDKEEVRQTVRNMRNMSTKKHTRVSKRDQAKIKRSADRLLQKYGADASSLDDGWQEIDEFVQNPESSEDEAGSLVQIRSEAGTKSLGPMMIIMIIVILVLLIAVWLIYTFWFCALAFLIPFLVPIIILLMVLLPVLLLVGLVKGAPFFSEHGRRRHNGGGPSRWSGSGGNGPNTAGRHHGGGSGTKPGGVGAVRPGRSDDGKGHRGPYRPGRHGSSGRSGGVGPFRPGRGSGPTRPGRSHVGGPTRPGRSQVGGPTRPGRSQVGGPTRPRRSRA